MALFDFRDFRDRAARNITRGRTTTLGENALAALEDFVENQTSISETVNLIERTEEIRDELRRRGFQDIPRPVRPPDPSGLGGGLSVERQAERFFGELQQRARETPEVFRGLPTTLEEARGITREEVEAARERAERVAFRAGTAGQVGQVLGGLTGAVSDPLILGSMLLGAPASAGILRTAGIEAGIGAGVEVPIQAGVQASRARLGLDASLERALENIAFAGIGGAVFGGGFRALGRLAGRAAGQASNAARLRVNERVREATLAAEAQRLAEGRVEVGPDLKSAVNTTTRIEEVVSQNPFVRDLPGSSRAFNETFDTLLTRIQADGQSSGRIRVNRPIDPESIRSSLDDAELQDTLVNLMRRTFGNDLAGASDGAANLGRALRQTATRNLETDQIEAVRATIGDVASRLDGDNAAELGRVFREGGRLDIEARKVRDLEAKADAEPTRGRRAAATRARNEFADNFEATFPNAEEGAAERFLEGDHPLAQAVETIRRVQPPEEDVFALSPEQVTTFLRNFQRPLTENVARGRGFSPIQQRRQQAEQILNAQRGQIDTLRSFARDDLQGDRQVLTVDDEGNEITTTVKDVLDDLEEDQRVLNEIKDCMGRI